MKEQVKELQKAMKALAETNLKLAIAQEQYEKNIHTDIQEKKAIQEQIDKLKNEIQILALAEFKETENKKLTGGIGIQEKSYIKYDLEKAFKFAKEKGMFLQLDKKAFEKAAPGLKLDFVEIGKTPQVTFPKEIKLED